MMNKFDAVSMTFIADDAMRIGEYEIAKIYYRQVIVSYSSVKGDIAPYVKRSEFALEDLKEMERKKQDAK